MYPRYIKRLLDIVISLCGIIILSPILLIILVLVRVKLGSPAVFKQDRPGRHEDVFKLYKFRTMTDARDENGELLPDKVRLTRFGRVLRSTSLDELPELINILKGDMSLVGPRPLLVEYLPYYTEVERIRHSVRPGLTVPDVLKKDVVQTWDNQFKSDVEYANNLTFMKDFKIVIGTFGKLIKRNQTQYGNFVRGKLSDERKDMVK